MTEALTHLKEKGFVSQEKYQGVHLTEQGLSIAKGVYERRCMLKKFFYEVLGAEEGQAEKDACKTEHLLNPAAVQKLQKFVQMIEEYKQGNPDFLKGLK